MNKPASFKLLKFKTWLTLADAAKHLSNICEGKVTEADILQLALDRHIKLSVKFINPVKATRGKVVGCEGTEWREIPSEVVDKLEEGMINNYTIKENGKVFELMSKDLGDGRFLNLNPGVITIPAGIFDLPMIGYSRIAVECKHQESIGGPAIDLGRHLPNADIDGVYAEDLDGSMFILQVSIDDIPDYPGSQAQLDKLINLIMHGGVSGEDAEELRAKYLDDSKKLLKHIASLPDSQTHFMADSLPEDSAFVIRTDALREFERINAGNELNINDDLSETERNTMLKLIIGMAIDAYGYDPDGKKNPATGNNNGSIKAALEKLGLSADEKTIKKYLNEAAARYPDAKPRKS